MEKLIGNLVKVFIIVCLLASCAVKKEVKMVIFSENHKTVLEDIIVYNNYNIEIIDNGNFWIIKNVNEEALLEFVGIARLKMDVIANNITNVDTENYSRKYVKITPENGIEVIDCTENVDIIKERLDMIETERLYQASIECLKKINESIIFM